jgi:hypothetical protein
LIDYLACQIANIYYCHVIPILLGIWRSVFRIIVLIQSAIYFGISSATQVALWANANIRQSIFYMQGFATNLTNQLTDAMNSATGGTFIVSGSQAGFFDFLIVLVNALRDALTTSLTQLTEVIRIILNFLSAIVDGISNLGSSIISAVGGFLNTTINSLASGAIELFRNIAIIPKILGSFNDGYSTTVENPMLGVAALSGGIAPPPMAASGGDWGGGYVPALNCSHDLVYHFCVGAYTLDNTVFGGSITIGGVTVYSPTGFSISMASACWAITVLIRFVRRFRKQIK